MSAFDEIFMAIRRDFPNIPVDRATAAATLECERRNLPTGSSISVTYPDDGALEDIHVDAGDKLVRALGGRVVRNSQKRASKVTPGVPDRIYFFPRHRVAAFWEAKRVGGKQSSAQILFQELCVACAWTYLVGPLRVLEEWLVMADIGREEPDGTWTPLPFHPLIEDRP